MAMASSRCRRPLFTSDTPHFFKVILARTLSERKLDIPKKFVRNHEKALLNDEVCLKVANGAEWNVGLTKSNEKVWFENGWQEFVEFYSVGFGYFLTFRYEGNSCFQVIIFDHSASEIEYPTTSGEFHERKKVFDGKNGFLKPNMRENEEIEDDGSVSFQILDNCWRKRRREDEAQTSYSLGNKKLKSRDNEGCKETIICSSRKMVELEPSRPEGFNSHELKKEKLLRNEDLHCSQFKVYARRSRAKQIKSEVNNKGMGNLATREEQQHVSRANTFKSKHDQDLRSVKIDSQDFEGHKVIKSENCRRKPPWAATEEASVIEKALTFKSMTANPSFMVTMGPSYIHTGTGYLTIPKSFAEIHLKKSEEMMVEVSDGRVWKIMCGVRWIEGGNRKKVEMGGGWRAFARDNNLEKGDICVFEIIKSNKISFKVAIFKAQDKKN